MEKGGKKFRKRRPLEVGIFGLFGAPLAWVSALWLVQTGYVQSATRRWIPRDHLGHPLQNWAC